jgi:putative cardiolipin synthase
LAAACFSNATRCLPRSGQFAILFEEAAAPDQAFQVRLTEPGNINAALVWSGGEHGSPVRYESEPLASVWRRIIASLLGALAPEEML